MKKNNMKDKVIQTIENVLYSNLEYSVCGNRYLLASNLLFNNIGIKDTDVIYKLAKIIEKNSNLEISDEQYNIIYENFVFLAKDYQSKSFDDILNLKSDDNSEPYFSKEWFEKNLLK